MTRITVRNKARVPVRWGGHIFRPTSDTVVDVPEEKIPRIAAQRRLRIVAVGGKVTGDGTPAWGSTVNEALAYVGDDKARAAEVLGAEQDRDRPRSSLVTALEELLETVESPAPAGEE